MKRDSKIAVGLIASLCIVGGIGIGRAVSGPDVSPIPKATQTHRASPKPAEAPTETSTGVPTLSAEDMQAIFDSTWSGTSDADKESMCWGIDQLGTDWVANILREKGGDDAGINWDHMAVLFEKECNK